MGFFPFGRKILNGLSDVLLCIVYRSIDVIRNALAMGADKGIHVQTDMSTDQEL